MLKDPTKCFQEVRLSDLHKLQATLFFARQHRNLPPRSRNPPKVSVISPDTEAISSASFTPIGWLWADILYWLNSPNFTFVGGSYQGKIQS